MNTHLGLINAVNLGLMMLGVEARDHRDHQRIKQAEAVEGAMRVMQHALDAAVDEMKPR